MTKEEIVTELLENYTWNVFAGNMWVNEDGRIFIPWDDEDHEYPLLLDVMEWVEHCIEEYELLNLTKAERVWVDQQVTVHFTDRYRKHLTEQLNRTHRAEVLNRLKTKESF